jgi:FtsZ-binding cell division protein ZapB
MDSAEAHIQIEDSVEEFTNIKTEDGMAEDLFKSVKLDGVEYKAEAKVAEALHVTQTRADSLQVEVENLTKKVSTLDAEKDVQKERADALDVELTELKKNHLDSSKLAEMVKSRVQLEATAIKVGVTLADGMDDVAVMSAVVKHKSPKANLEGKDAVYIKARFDGIVEDMAVEEVAHADAGVRSVAGSVAHADSGASATDGAKRYRENLINQSKEKK